MPTFGVRTEKTGANDPAFSNTYYVISDTLANAAAIGETIALIEQELFADDVTIINVHAWVPNADPNNFTNLPLDLPGTVATTAPIPSEICAEISWGVVGSYTHYKRYRIHWDSASILGTGWVSSAITLLDSATEAFSDLMGTLCTRGGVPLGGPSFNSSLTFQRTYKAWYDRDDEE